MDFTVQYTKEQEEFRKEVRIWVEANAKYPKELGELPVEEGDLSREMWLWGRDFQRKLGAKGWLQPLLPTEYGGGGLSGDETMVLREELDRVPYPRAYSMAQMVIPAVFVYGTEEQKQQFLTPICRGEVVCWQAFTEPGAGSDLAGLQTRAIRDGDDFVFNGQKAFIGGPHDPDFLWALAMTDPDAPRHRNIGAFLVPANTPGVTITDMDTIAREGKRIITFDGARVPREYLIGGETQGWQVAQSSLEVEHGAGGSTGEGDPIVKDVIEYCKKAVRNGQPMSRDPYVQKELVDLFIESNVNRLMGLRNYWLFSGGLPTTYQGSQSSLVNKNVHWQTAIRIVKALGPYALTRDEEWGPLKGAVEVHQRHVLMSDHRGGTTDIQKIIIARRLGISRTRERAAPTQSTHTG